MLRLLTDCRFDTCYISSSPYGYRPSLAASILLLVVYFFSLVGCLLFTITTQQWYLFSTFVATSCILEIVGYGVRIGSWVNPWDMRLYSVDTVMLSIAPSLISVAIYFTAEKMLQVLGKEHSPIRPSGYKHLMHLDFAGIIVQLIGFGIAFSDMSATTGLGTNANKGGHIVAAGISLQVMALAMFLGVFSKALLRVKLAISQYGYSTFQPSRAYVALSRNFIIFVVMVIIGTNCLVARGIFRITSLAEGFNESIARNETYFAVFDGVLVAETVVGLVMIHPAYVLQDDEKRTRLQKRDSNVDMGTVMHLIV